ncbi:MAG TPA: hypothetical protein VF546_01335 [Pyrinomonadaceae bacterium]|jgi:hypothetical protein
MKRLDQSNLWLVMIIVTVIVSAISITAKAPPAAPQAAQAGGAELPPITSKIKRLKVVRTTVRHPESRGASVVLELENDSDLPVIALTVSFGNKSISKDGGMFSDPPEVVIPPHETHRFSIVLRDLDKRIPVVVSAVIYADGTEEGWAEVLREMHEERVYERAKRAAQKKGVNP